MTRCALTNKVTFSMERHRHRYEVNPALRIFKFIFQSVSHNPVRDEPSVLLPHICTSLSRSWVKIPSSRMSKREWSLSDEKVYATKKRPSRDSKKTVSYLDMIDSELVFEEDPSPIASRRRLPTATATSSSSALTHTMRTSPSRPIPCFRRWSRWMRRCSD